MERPAVFGVAFAVALLLSPAPGKAGDDSMVRACRNARAMTNSCSNVATAQKDATYTVSTATPGAEALELTARPLAVDPASAYLVQVFVDPGPHEDAGAQKLIGSFSFFPAKVGEAQTFVLPPPPGDATASKKLNLSIKLVAANASRTLKDSAVEIVGARLVKE